MSALLSRTVSIQSSFDAAKRSCAVAAPVHPSSALPPLLPRRATVGIGDAVNIYDEHIDSLANERQQRLVRNCLGDDLTNLNDPFRTQISELQAQLERKEQELTTMKTQLQQRQEQQAESPATPSVTTPWCR